MNIFFFDLATVAYPGGCEKYFAHLAKYMSERNTVSCYGSRVYNTFMSYIYYFVTRRKIEPIAYVKRDIGKGKMLDLGVLSFIPFSKPNRELQKKLLDTDIIYTKNEFQELLFLYLLLGKKKYSKKVIVGVHSAIFIPESVKGIWKLIHELQYTSYFYKKFLLNARLIHVINTDDTLRLNKMYGIKLSKIKYIPYPIDWDNSLSETKSKKFEIFWAGRLTLQKGIDRLQEIIELLSQHKEFNDIHIVIAGHGEEEDTMIALQKKYKNISYKGYVEDMKTQYLKTDLSIVTSYFETFGYNVLEPQSFGIPVVSFDITGPKDIINNKKTGYLVSTNEEFVTTILKYLTSKLKDERKYVQMKKTIRFSVNQNFNKVKIFRELEKIFMQTAKD